MEDSIKQYKKLTKKYKLISLFFIILTIISISLFANKAFEDSRIVNNSTAIVDFCSSSFTKENLSQMKNFCNEVFKMKDILIAYQKVQFMGTSPRMNIYSITSMLYMILSVILIYFSIYYYDLTATTPFIKKHFSLNENEEFLYEWISSLKFSKKILDENEFNQWMTGFEDRYSSNELSVMKLNFLLR